MIQRGFTLLEMLLSVTIIGLVSGLSVPVFFALKARSDVTTNSYRVVEAIRRAQSYSMDARDDSAWSIRVDNSAVTLYKGVLFDARPIEDDETVVFDGVVASGLTGISFAKVTGSPSSTGDITIKSNNESKVLSVNAKGMVQF